MTTTTESMLGILTGELAGSLLQSALTGQPQGRVPGFRHEVDRVQARAGAETSVSYRIWYQAAEGEVSDYLVATTADVVGSAQVAVAGQTVNIWRHPADPNLPALALATRADVLSGWLGTQITTERVELPVYRPLRRAVVRASAGSGTHQRSWDVKVVRPTKLADIVERHQVFAAAGLGPEVLHVEPTGALVVASAAGQSLANLLSSWQRGATQSAPDAIDLIDALDALPARVMDLPAHPSWTERTWFHAEMAAVQLPDQAAEIAWLGERITELASVRPVGDLVPTHGDCYEANIFWDGHTPTFIDLDSAGPGHRVDDLACMLAHLAVLPQLSIAHYPLGNRVVADWYEQFAKRVDPAALCVRTAAVLLSLVSGCADDTARHRLDLVRAWLMRAVNLSAD